MADKLALTNLTNLQNETSAVNAINANNAALIAAVNLSLFRDGTTPNQMGADFDMNSHRIINLPSPNSNTEPVRLVDLINAGQGHFRSANGRVEIFPVAVSTPNTLGNLVLIDSEGVTRDTSTMLPAAAVQAAINIALPTSPSIHIFQIDPQRDIDIRLGYAGDHLPISWPAYQNVASRITGTGFLDVTQDSTEMCDFQYVGTQLFSWVFNPLGQGAPGGDSLFQHVDSRFFATTVFNVSFPKASFTNNTMEIVELNADPQLVQGTPLFSVPSVGSALQNWGSNSFTMHHVHGNGPSTVTYFQIGNGTPAAGKRFGNNFWNLHIDATGGNGAQDGFSTWASKDIKILRADGFTAGGKTVWYHPGAQDNILILQGDAANGTPVTDENGAANRNIQIIGGYGMYFGGAQYMRSETHSRYGFPYADDAINSRGTVINTTPAGTSGQILVAQTGAVPVLQTPTQYFDNVGTTDNRIINRQSGSWVSTANPMFGGTGGVSGTIRLLGSTSGTITLSVPATAGTGTLTLPAATDTLIGKATADTLTNKTFDTATNSLFINSIAVSRGQYPGIASNVVATAGNIGEFVESTLPVGSAISLTSGVNSDVTTISLTAGDWDVEGVVVFSPAATTSVTIYRAATNTTSATLPADTNYASIALAPNVPNGNMRIVTPRTRVTVNSTTTVSLVSQAAFTVSTMTTYGYISARRVR